MENIVRTVYGAYLQTCMLRNLPFSMLENTTLNEKFGIEAGIQPSSTVIPRMAAFCIGNGGHRLTVGSNNIPKTEPVQHDTTDAALFNHLPFVMRELTNDLTLTQRAKYCLRREELHNGTRWAVYYGKRIIDPNATASMIYKKVASDGSETTSAFIPTSANLNPAPKELSSSGVNITTGDYVAASSITSISLDAFDVAELLNVANILYGDEGYAIVSEIALISGVDKPVSVASGGSSSFTFNELIAAQVVSFIDANYPVKYSNDGMELVLDVGATEPLYALTNGGTGVTV